jgi:predicted nucleic acid-binding Zn ribbon protein
MNNAKKCIQAIKSVSIDEQILALIEEKKSILNRKKRRSKVAYIVTFVTLILATAVSLFNVYVENYTAEEARMTVAMIISMFMIVSQALPSLMEKVVSRASDSIDVIDAQIQTLEKEKEILEKISENKKKEKHIIICG